MTTLHPELEALMPEPVGFRSRFRSEPEMIGHYPWTWAGAERRRRKYDRPECEYEDLFTADQMREAMLAATERAAKQRKDIEKALLWCVRNLTEYGHRRMLSDPSNGVMRAVEAIHAASLREGGSKPAQALDGEAGEPT